MTAIKIRRPSPRMWSSMAEVPDGTKVRSRFGDVYVGSFTLWGRDLGASMRLRYAAPFTEIVSDDSPGRVDVQLAGSVWAVMGGAGPTLTHLCSLWQTQVQAQTVAAMMSPYYEGQSGRWQQRWRYEVKQLSLCRLVDPGGGQ